MAGYLRLRQICLVAPHLEPVMADIAAIMGLGVCYRDGNVGNVPEAVMPLSPHRMTDVA